MELVNQQQLEVKNNKLANFFSNNFLLLRNIAFFVFAFLTIFMFVMLMIPSTAGHSQLNYVNQTAFYSVKYNSDFTKYYVGITPAGIVLLILNILAITFLVMLIVFNKKNILETYSNLDKKSKTKKITFDSIIYLGLLLVFTLMFIFVLIPPNFSKVMNFYWTQVLQESVNSSDRASIILGLNKLGVTSINGMELNNLELTTGILNAEFQATIARHAVSFMFTPFTTFNTCVVAFSNGIYAVIVLFSMFFGLAILAYVVSYVVSNGLKINLSFNKERFVQIQQKLKEKQDYRKQINKTKKELLDKESELLKDLHEINLEKVDQEKKLGLISQEELETKISKNNEIKKQLEELVKQKAEINKQKIANSKIRSALNKAQAKNNNKTTRKDKKQTITIPDKELDEIFKNLEID